MAGGRRTWNGSKTRSSCRLAYLQPTEACKIAFRGIRRTERPQQRRCSVTRHGISAMWTSCRWVGSSCASLPSCARSRGHLQMMGRIAEPRTLGPLGLSLTNSARRCPDARCRISLAFQTHSSSGRSPERYSPAGHTGTDPPFACVTDGRTQASASQTARLGCRRKRYPGKSHRRAGTSETWPPRDRGCHDRLCSQRSRPP